MKETVVDPIAMVSAKIDNFFPNDEWDPETLILDTNLDPEQTTNKITYRTEIEDRISISKNLKIKKSFLKTICWFYYQYDF